MVNQYWLRGVIGTGAYATVERATHMGDKIDYVSPILLVGGDRD